MERPFARSKCFCVVTASIALLAAHAATFAETRYPARVAAFSGAPTVISTDGSKLPLRANERLRVDQKIQTGPDDWVELQFSEKKGCRFILEPDSLLAFKEGKAPEPYEAFLGKGTLSFNSDFCQSPLDLATTIGRLRGRKSKFSVKVYEETTVIYLLSGDLRLYVGGESIPLREMTRTTISHSGSHRIASIGETHPPLSTFPPPVAFQDTPIPPRAGIAPVSATTKRP